MSASSDPAVLPLGKHLASPERKTRDTALKNLRAYLSSDSGNVLPDLEMAKLWKGIFYCFWITDKPFVQQGVAGDLAELVLTISDVPSSLKFLRGFWTMTVREWNGIDRLRMDKYYMLVRKFVNASFRLLIRTKWDKSAIEEYNSILSGPNGPLCSNDIRVPASLAFHLSDIYLEELDKALSGPPPRPPPVPLSMLLSPFISLAARTPAKTTYGRIQSSLFEPLDDALKSSSSASSSSAAGPPSRKKARTASSEYSNLLANACACSGSESQGAIDADAIRKSVLQKVSDVASETETRDANRRKMCAFWKYAVDDDENAVDDDENAADDDENAVDDDENAVELGDDDDDDDDDDGGGGEEKRRRKLVDG